MGVSLDAWRQRIGCFRQRPSTSSKSRVEVVFPSSPVFGLGSFTYLLILLGVFSATFLFRDLTVYGDVEKNPGPDTHTPQTPDLPADLLTSLKNGTCASTATFNHALRNKHILQLLTKKDEKEGSGWPKVVEWIKLFYPDQDFSDQRSWAKLLRESWNAVKNKYKSLNKNAGRKSGQKEFEMFLEKEYRLPQPRPPKSSTNTQSASSPPTSLFDIQVLQTENKKLQDENIELKERNTRLLSEIETLKQRPSPHTQKNSERRERDHRSKIQAERSRVKDLEKDHTRLEKQLDSAKAAKRSLKSDFEKSTKFVKRDAEMKLEVNRDYATELETQVDALRQKVVQLNETNEELLSEIDRLTCALHEAKEAQTINFYDEEKWCFLPRLHKLVWNLLSQHVSFAKVSEVIQTVLDVCGIDFDRLPSETTVRNMNKDRTLVAQVQLASIAGKSDTTISSDETPSAGDKIMAFAITDEENQSYVLSLRQMASKSAQHTLDTLKETLQDISDICSKANAGNEVGHQILCQIRNTMSDRAATETLFHKMLYTYREECLPLYTENWDNFSDEAKAKLSEMYNFFCGLHLLTSMADAVAASFKTFENDFLDEEKVGAVAIPGLNIFNTASGSIRLVQNACKALSRGGDEKSGCYRHWNVYKACKNLSQTYFLPFRGNRFNVVFMFGGRVYFLIKHICEFLGVVHGTSNGLLKALLADAKEPLYVAGCKVLGIVNKAISAPLWRVTEKGGHIFDLCIVYTGLVQFLTNVTEDEDRLADFAYGRINFFDDEYIEKDEVYDAVLSPGPHDEIVLSMLQHTLLTLLQLYKRVCVDYLPGGKFHVVKDDEEKRKVTISAPLHNKLPERIFGYFDFLTKKRPNASTAANEAQVLYTFNKTNEFVDSKTEDELAELVELVKSQRGIVKARAKDRQLKIHEYWKAKQDASAKALAASRQRALNKKENLTNDITDTGLFQTGEQVDEYLSSERSASKKFETIKKQIRFRREVLNQYMEGDKGFTFTSAVEGSKKRINKPIDVMKSHLLKLINAAKSVAQSVSVQKTPDNEILTIPLLVGKKVHHVWTTENGDETFIGTVISQVPGFRSWFNIKYEDDPKVYSLRLVDDYNDGTLSILV